jgi:cytidyltransferase-like protein
LSLKTSGALADGCFDPLHYGHIRYLYAAACLDCALVVNVAPDEAIRAKGREPFQSLAERRATVAAIKGVSEVVSGDLVKAITVYKPHFLIKGVEWAGRLPENVVAACRQAGTTIIYTDTRERSSTERLA